MAMGRNAEAEQESQVLPRVEKASMYDRSGLTKETRNEVLTKAGSTKGVRHFEFQCVCSTIQYEVGDVVELLSSENPSAIDAFLEHCDLDPKSFITVMSFYATAEHEKERPQYFASPEGRDDLYNYNQEERKHS
ncbi:hypothetical protein CARUB_v10016196mg [Capsella rubella]|uniref:Sulfite reductase [NADPH] flavoprotein alpha-component-like FAD-binding domain-containing protein n=1 Tax=Capsella rubella TaxID=81985 RepID=R0GBB2_9BRAS|nr:hypothetical protein CARUB_v10016196mg [Capsella rubella]